MAYGIKKIIFNEPATIIIWDDGIKTVSKCLPEDTYDKKIGLALCILKKIFKSNAEINKLIQMFDKKSVAKDKPQYAEAVDYIRGQSLIFKLLDGWTLPISVKNILCLYFDNESEFFIVEMKDMQIFKIKNTYGNRQVLRQLHEDLSI